MVVRILSKNKYVIGPRLNGWIQDTYDRRDDEFSIHNSPLAETEIVPTCDNRKYFLGVSNQFDMPSCTANACVDAFEAGLVKSFVDSGSSLEEAKKLVPNLSRMFAWYWGRSFMSLSQANNAESGCFNRLIMEVISRFGVPPEELWPYDRKILPPYGRQRPVVRPSISSQRAAKKYQSDKFYNIPNTDKDALIDGIDKALSAGHNVAWGTIVGTNVTEYVGGIIGPPKDLLGGHAMVLCGKEGDAYWNRNSWGEGWGMGGYSLVSKELITWEESSSFWVSVPEAVK